MNKIEFINELKIRLSTLPQSEIDKSVSYYDEIISDRIEDGMTEEEAIMGLSDIDKIVSDIMHDMTLPTLMKARLNDSKEKASNKTLWIILVIIGSPIWFPILLAFGIVLLSIYIVAWSIILTIYIVEVAFAFSCIFGIIGGIVTVFTGNVQAGIYIFGTSLVLGGLSILLFKPIILLTKEFARFTAFIAKKTKTLFIKKEVK